MILALFAVFVFAAYTTTGYLWLTHVRRKHLLWWNKLHEMYDKGDIPVTDWASTAASFDRDILAISPWYWLKHWRDNYPLPATARYHEVSLEEQEVVDPSAGWPQ